MPIRPRHDSSSRNACRPRLPAAASALLAAALASGAAAAPPRGVELESGTTRARRDALVEALRAELRPGETGVFLLSGAAAPQDSRSEFRQLTSFHYLSGVTTPGAHLLLVFDARILTERLYLPPREPAKEAWTGVRLGPGGTEPGSGALDSERRRVIESTGLRGSGEGAGDGVAPEADLKPHLERAFSGAAVQFLEGKPAEESRPPSAEEALTAPLRAGRAAVRLASARDALVALRVVKDAGEIERIRRAVEITCAAQREALAALRPGSKEYEVEALVEYVFTRSGAREAAFPTIVGSGPNSCVLHYEENERTIEEGDLVVLDAGAEYRRYAADVTRTWPASGRFTDEQRRVYLAVLRAQEAARAILKPGVSLRTLDERAKAVLAEEGLEKHALHFCCHMVGMDVHDPGDRDLALRPGMVLTIEPGVYMTDKALGVRIEDTFLVTAEGSEKLSACLPSAPVEVEAAMAARTGAAANRPPGSGSPPR